MRLSARRLGVPRCAGDRALDLLSGQFKSTMQFLGMTSVAELRKHGRDLLTREA